MSSEAGGEQTEGPQKKRKSRWGGPDDHKKSRWGNKKENSTTQVMDALNSMSNEQKELYAVRCKLAQVSQRLLALEANPEGNPNEERSPSPEPTYDAAGVRTNCRAVRTKAKLMTERTALLEQAVALNPLLASTVSMGKKSRKLPIPQAEYPDCNFIGLIIGPRGNTQKRLEQETGAKISIRGKGAHKNLKNLKAMEPQPGDDEDLHVLVTGDTDEIVEAASKHIEELLKPVSELSTQHKLKQLRELAQINGTNMPGVICRSCGQEGHKLYDCPNREKSWKPASVFCSLCGSGTHPDQDCTRPVTTVSNVQAEYSQFISELSGDQPEDKLAKATSAVEKAKAIGDLVVSNPVRAPVAHYLASVSAAPGEELAPGEEPTPSAPTSTPPRPAPPTVAAPLAWGFPVPVYPYFPGFAYPFPAFTPTT